MNINLTELSDKEIAGICIKYNIIQANELKNYTREKVLLEVTQWCHYKKSAYRERSKSSPNLMNMNPTNPSNK